MSGSRSPTAVMSLSETSIASEILAFSFVESDPTGASLTGVRSQPLRTGGSSMTIARGAMRGERDQVEGDNPRALISP